jgi:SPP1 family predicted phage head-tail adaptor
MTKHAVGDYDQRITVYQNKSGRSANPDGQRPEDGEVVCTRWGKALPVTGTENFQNQQTAANVTWRVWIHSDAESRTIAPKMWLVLADGTRLNVLRAFDPDGRRMEIELECVERV